MMKMFSLLFVLLCAYKTLAEDVIYYLEDEDYHRMPSKYHLDRFQKCLGVPGGSYCTVWADLVSDKPSELLHMVQAYSAHESKHFNYSNIKYGLCLTSTCKQFYDGDKSQQAMWNTSEACLNESLTRDYDLKARVTDIDCYHHGHQFEYDHLDFIIITVLGIILALNVFGTVYYIWFRDQTKPENKFLNSFSIIANWKHLVAPSSTHPDQVRLRGFNGIRALSSMLVILGHIPIDLINTAANPDGFEKMYRILPLYIFHQGHAITQAFFSMSGFLLAYNMELYAEKNKLSWKLLIKATVARWLRLTPANLVVLMLTVIWYKYITVGPLFKELVMVEATDCQKYWMYNLFYVSNLIDHSQCNLQVWFLAADMQLHILGMAVIVLIASQRARQWALAALYLVGVGYPVYLVYTMDLDGVLMATPNTVNKYFLTNPAFNLIFKTTVPNLPSFVIGMAFGYLVYSMHKKGLLNHSYRKYRVGHWMSLTLMFTVLLLGYVFYRDTSRPGLWLRLIFAANSKPASGFFCSLVALGTICRCEDLVRGILEWDGWMPITRISYCIFLVHVLVVRYTGGSRDALSYTSQFHLSQEYLGVTCVTILFATILHLLVEAPFAELFKLWMAPRKSTKKLLENEEEKEQNEQHKLD